MLQQKIMCTTATLYPLVPRYMPLNGKQGPANGRGIFWLTVGRGLTRDPSTYPMANTFLPDRWLNPSYPTYREPLTVFPRLEGHSQFGYGRRNCMGVDIVNHELFLVCGALAWAFDMKKKIGGERTRDGGKRYGILESFDC
jgi:hypothetical protein